MGESYAPDEYFYIGFWILVSGNTKGNWEFLLKKKTGRARSKRKPLSWAGNPGRNFRHQRWARFGHLSREPLPALDGTAGDVVVNGRTVRRLPRVPLRYALPGAYRAAAAERETEPCDNSPGQDRAAVCGDRFMIPNRSGARGRRLPDFPGSV